MDAKQSEMHGKQDELHAKRKELHGKRRKLHECLSEVCEEFVLSDMTKEHKQKALVRELQYLLDYYQDDASWEGIR
jgi:DNA repair exonuclease SbcCD ATPase subunit